MDGFVFLNPAMRIAPGTKVVKAGDFADFAEAGRLLERAEARARAIEARAEEAYREEKRKGYEEGLREGRAETTRLMMDTVSKAMEYLEDNEGRIIALVAAALRKILGEVGETERIVAVVRSALAVVSKQEEILVRVPPDKVQAMQDSLREILRQYPRVKSLQAAADPELQGTRCILETKIGKVEASLEAQLEAITRAMTALAQGRASDLERKLRTLERDLVRSLQSAP